MAEEERLVITHVVLNNFKSFYGKKVIGSFHPQFTSVVGPNGSGKSNLLDAMLFVFGFTAHSMRPKTKLSDIVHHSAAHPNVQKAEVQVRFARVDHENNLIPGSEFTISRDVVAGSGQSSYYMNGARSTYSQVTEFLRNLGVDLDRKRFIIKQGEVRSISRMKPKGSQNQAGLLEYLEDIVGSNCFIEPINTCEEELKVINEERDIKADRRNAAQKERDALRESKEQAERYLRKQEELKVIEAKKLYLNRTELEERNKEMKAEIEEMAKEVETLQAELDEIVKKETDTINDQEKCTMELRKVKKESDAKVSELTELKNKLTSNRMKLKHLEETTKKNEEEVVNMEKQAKAAEAVIESRKENMEKAHAQLEEKQQKLEEEKQELAKLMEQVKAETVEIQEKLRAVEEEFSIKNSSLLEVKKEVTQARDEITAIRRKAEDARNKKEQRQRLLEDTRKTIDTLTERHRTTQEEIENKKSRYEELQGLIEENERKYEEALEESREKAKNYNEKKRLKEQSAADSAIDKCIEELKRETGCEGIYGKLAKLGTIDPKYDVAVTTAAGNRLNEIVVQSVEIAKMCLRRLEEKKVGYATCLVLDDIAHREQKTLDEIPEGASRVIDAISISDPKFQPAFYKAVQNTLVCTAEDAERIAFGQKQRHRVVTFDGMIIETSGTLTGGGQKKRGGMSLVTDQELEKARQDLEEIDNRTRELKQQLDALKSEYRTVNITELELTFRKIEMDLRSYTQQAETLQAELEQAVEYVESEDDVVRVQELEQFVTEKEPTLTEKQQEVDSLAAAVKQFEKEIHELSTTRTKKQREAVKHLEQEIEGIGKEIGRFKAQITSSERKIAQANATVAELKKAIEENGVESEKLSDEITKQAELKKEKKAQVKETQEKVDELEAKIAEFQKEIRKMKDDCNKRGMVIGSKKSELQKKKAENKAVRKELKQIILKFEKTGISEDQVQDEEKSLRELELQKAAIESQLEAMDPDLSAIKEWEEKDEQFRARHEEFTECDTRRTEKMRELNDLRVKRKNMFDEGFKRIADKLKETYQLLTLGGDAELEYVDRLDPFGQGIIFSVRPSGKSWKPIFHLSGGEQALSSLSLVFALHEFKPTPFYIMDEIDAALDVKNVSIIANYLRTRTTNAQFIVVSLRNNMFELANRLIGVFKVHDCASALVIDQEQEEGDVVPQIALK